MPSKDADRRRRTHGPRAHGPRAHGPRAHGPRAHGPRAHGPRLLLRKPLLIAITALALALGGASVAAGASNIEGVWSFNGGQIAIQPAAGGTFTGTVVIATAFAECVHPVGQQIWTGMTLQPDGSYQGSHQWYLASCSLNPTLGPTAWRVLTEPNGSSRLRVCFSHPGTSQPAIAPDGTSSGATYGCADSALTAPLPTAPGSNPGSNPGSGSGSTPVTGVAGEVERLSLPSSKKCLSGRQFKIHLLDPKYDPLKTVTVTLKGHKIKTARKGNYIVATINLRGLPRSAFTIKIHATTVLGHRLSASRTYHTCIRKIVNKPSKKKSSSKG